MRPAFDELVAEATDLYVGGAAGLLGDVHGAELEACQRLLEVLERRAAVLSLLQDALDPKRPVIRVGPELEGEELHGAVYVGATYGLANRSLGAVGLLGPLRMDYEKAIRSVRAAAFELSRLVDDVYGSPLMATAEQDYYELLGVSRDASHAEIKSAFRRLARELHPDVSDDPDAGPRFRAVAEAYEVLADPERRQLYDRFGHAGVRGGGFAPMTDFGSLSDVFAAFFGETLFGTAGQTGARACARAGSRRAGRDRPRRRRQRDDARRPRPCRTDLRALRRAPEPPPEPPRSRALRARASAVSSRSRGRSSGRWSARGRARAATGAGTIVETPCERCGGDGRTIEDVPLELDVPAGIHDGQRIRVRRSRTCRRARRTVG